MGARWSRCGLRSDARRRHEHLAATRSQRHAEANHKFSQRHHSLFQLVARREDSVPLARYAIQRHHLAEEWEELAVTANYTQFSQRDEVHDRVVSGRAARTVRPSPATLSMLRIPPTSCTPSRIPRFPHREIWCRSARPRLHALRLIGDFQHNSLTEA